MLLSSLHAACSSPSSERYASESASMNWRISSTELLAAMRSRFAGRVDAVEAGRNGGRATDAQMHFLCARAAHHAHNFSACRAADDGVVDEDDALAFEQIVHRVELEAHAEVAHALLGLDEGAAHVVVADEAEAEGNAGLFRVAERGGDAGVGHGHDHVGGHAGLARQLAAHLVARLLHPAAEDAAVGARKVDVLEDAARLRHAAGVLAAGDAVFGDHHQFAGKNIAHVLGAQQIEGAGFRGKDDGVGRRRDS